MSTCETGRAFARRGSEGSVWPSMAATWISAMAVLLLGSPLSAAGPSDLTKSPTMLAVGDDPNFDGVAYLRLDCDPGGDPQGDENPGACDLVGDATFPATYFARDSKYLHFRFRVDQNPSGPNGFAQYAWVILLQVPSGSAFQHQYELALNGIGAPDDFGNVGGQKGDTVEIWANSAAHDVDFSPLFNDPSETRLFA